MLESEPRPFSWTRESYECADRAGIFDHLRVKLIEGVVFQKKPLSPKQCVTIGLLSDELRRTLTPNCHVRQQAPLDVNERSQPAPHIAVVRGAVTDYLDYHPTQAELIVEVPDSAPEFDRTVKASVYAGAKISEYWLVNLNEELVEIYRNPYPRLGYKSALRVRRGEKISLLAAPSAVIEVDRLLPKRK